jgi:alpha-maltose-1-phosphate synthase
MGVLVSHPHAGVVSREFAAALDRHDALARYVTGIAYAPSSVAERWALRFGESFSAANRSIPGIRPKRILPLVPVELLSRALGRAGLIAPYDALFSLHDAAVSRLPWPRDVSAVYAFEDGALRTFEKAQRLGVARVWDLPLPHYATIGRMWERERASWPAAQTWFPKAEAPSKFARKDRELELATVVVTASRFTRDSLDGVVDTTPIVTIPYGYPVDEFPMKAKAPQRPFRVLSVGGHDLRKGTPYLLEAWKRAELKEAELRLVGRMSLTPAFLSEYQGRFQHTPSQPRALLPSEYQAADVLVFPTLGDGFGLVIQEAMSSGTPVVTTRCGGGPECIVHGENGWIVPERDVEALVETLRYLASNRDHVARVGEAARRTAEKWTWREAGDAYVKALENHLR